MLSSSFAVRPNIIFYNSEDGEEYCRCERSMIIWGEISSLCLCLSQSTSKWQIITCLCREGPTTTTMPMWNSFWTLLNAYLFRYHHTRNISSFPTVADHFLSLIEYLLSCVPYRQCGQAGVMPQRTPNSQSCFTSMALPSWVREAFYSVTLLTR